jgi:hypothetical protein
LNIPAYSQGELSPQSLILFTPIVTKPEKPKMSTNSPNDKLGGAGKSVGNAIQKGFAKIHVCPILDTKRSK